MDKADKIETDLCLFRMVVTGCRFSTQVNEIE